MSIRTSLLVGLLSVTLPACTLVEVEYEDEGTSQVPEEDRQVRETNNVTYTGVVQPAGISIYQQGSHRLSLPGGKFILLESKSIDLNGYVDEKVQIFGALRPTIEAGGMIMRVERIELLTPEEPVSDETIEELVEDVPAEEVEESEETEESEEAEEGSQEELEVAEVTDGAEEQEGEETVEQEPQQEPDQEESVEPTPEFLERIAVMARQEYTADNWTQEYCTSHIGFCAPVHRNWWFKSFGATNSALWHVEFSSEPIESLGEGPITLELMAGSIGDADGSIDVIDGTVVGYKEWTFGRHFRISAQSKLEAAVSYMTTNIAEFTQ